MVRVSGASAAPGQPGGVVGLLDPAQIGLIVNDVVPRGAVTEPMRFGDGQGIRRLCGIPWWEEGNLGAGRKHSPDQNDPCPRQKQPQETDHQKDELQGAAHGDDFPNERWQGLGLLREADR